MRKIFFMHFKRFHFYVFRTCSVRANGQRDFKKVSRSAPKRWEAKSRIRNFAAVRRALRGLSSLPSRKPMSSRPLAPEKETLLRQSYARASWLGSLARVLVLQKIHPRNILKCAFCYQRQSSCFVLSLNWYTITRAALSLNGITLERYLGKQ